MSLTLTLDRTILACITPSRCKRYIKPQTAYIELGVLNLVAALGKLLLRRLAKQEPIKGHDTMTITTIFFEDVRCFHIRQSVSLKPITVLVGENSTGKTTFLALTRLVWDLCQAEDVTIDFNEEPFLLGTYDQIASYRGGKSGRAKSFTLGAQVRTPPSLLRQSGQRIANVITVSGEFVGKGTVASVKTWLLDAGDYQIRIDYAVQGKAESMTVVTPSGTVKIVGDELALLGRPRYIIDYMRYMTSESSRNVTRPEIEGDLPSRNDLMLLERISFEYLQSLGKRPYAFAPIRTRPHRIYEPLKDVPVPEGSHIPIVLARTYTSDPRAWESLRKTLTQFGQVSGLFTDVEIRRMGRKESDPFQIRVKISGPAFNLVDVGYGVSQALPIVVDALRQDEETTFLIQQPEVHLHPKARAKNTIFLAFLAKHQHKQFLIETHSDYLADRIRMDIRDSKDLKPSDVSILYFERNNTGVSISPLEVDKFGNIVNAPTGYRQFFLEEERRLLGV